MFLFHNLYSVFDGIFYEATNQLNRLHLPSHQLSLLTMWGRCIKYGDVHWTSNIYIDELDSNKLYQYFIIPYHIVYRIKHQSLARLELRLAVSWIEFSLKNEFDNNTFYFVCTIKIYILCSCYIANWLDNYPLESECIQGSFQRFKWKTFYQNFEHESIKVL